MVLPLAKALRIALMLPMRIALWMAMAFPFPTEAFWIASVPNLATVIRLGMAFNLARLRTMAMDPTPVLVAMAMRMRIRRMFKPRPIATTRHLPHQTLLVRMVVTRPQDTPLLRSHHAPYLHRVEGVSRGGGVWQGLSPRDEKALLDNLGTLLFEAP